MAPPAAPAAPGDSPRRTASRSPEKDADRFALPTVSMIQSKSGKLSYGLQGRLSVKMRAERRGRGAGVAAALWTPRQPRQSAASAEIALDKKSRTEARPSPYVAAILEREQRWGHAATQQRAAARWANTSYGTRVREAAGVARALTWPAAPAGPAAAPSPYLAQAAAALAPGPPRRCATAPAPAAAGLTWSLDRQLLFQAASPRFAAHAATEALRAATPDPSAARNAARLAHHAARRASAAARAAAIQALADTWPHGLPAARRLSAARKGLGVLGGVGYGASAQSMPQAQYLALKSTLKGP